MKVTVFGAGGGTGKAVVRAALAAGHEVTAFVRTPGRLDVTHARLTVVQGDATVANDVAKAVARADAVVSAIGGKGMGPSTQITDCVTEIVSRTRAANPKARLIAVSTVGAGDSGRQMPFPIRQIMGLLLRNAIKDHNGQESVIRNSGLDWTIARCVGLTDDPARGEAHVAVSERVGGSRVSRADVASWIVANLDRATYSQQAVALW